MSNNILFGVKEPQMVPFNALIERNKLRFEQFLHEIAKTGPQPPCKESNKPMTEKAFSKLKSEIVSIIDKIEPTLHSNI